MSDIALLFPGQGSHEDGMQGRYAGSSLLERGLDLLDYNPFDHLADGTRYQQPALFLCGVAAWEMAGRPVPAAAAGHSLGEYAALVAAGALLFEDALLLVDARAAAMATAAERVPGAMVAMLGGDPTDVAALATQLGLVIANDNAPGQIVLAGPREAVEDAERRAREISARARILDVSGAFHSPLMQPAAATLRSKLAGTPVSEPLFPVYSNGSAAPFIDIRSELGENLLRCVRWRETLLAMHDDGINDFQECGPGQVLTGMVKRTLRAEAPA